MNIQRQRKEYETIQTLFREVRATPTVVVSLDVEVWDIVPNPVRITEIDIATRVIGKDQQPRASHYTVDEHKKRKNRYCKTNPDGFAFGDTQVISCQAYINTKLTRIFESLQQRFGRVVLAGFSTKSDLRFCQEAFCKQSEEDKMIN